MKRKGLLFTIENKTDFTLVLLGTFALVDPSATQGSWYNSQRWQSQFLTEVLTQYLNNHSPFWSKDFLQGLCLVCVCVCAQLCPTLCDPIDCSPPRLLCL